MSSIGLESCVRENKMSFAVKGALRVVKPSKSVLAPIMEAIMNSIEANAKNVQLMIKREGLILNNNDLNDFSVIVSDDGDGFDVNLDNDGKIINKYGRFEILFTDQKLKNNKGCGRLQYLHFFKECEIQSKSKHGDMRFKFHQDSKNENGIDDITEPLSLSNQFNTEVYLRNIKEKYRIEFLKNVSNISDLKESILSSLFHKLVLLGDEMPSLKIVFEDKTENITKDDIKYPKEETIIKVSKVRIKKDKDGKMSYEETGEKCGFKLIRYQVKQDRFKNNSVSLCAKDIMVQDIIGYLEIGKNALFDDQTSRYVCFITGESLDDSVNESRDGFDLPKKKDLKKSDDGVLFEDHENDVFLCFDDILKAIKEKFTDLSTELKAKKDNRDRIIDEVSIELNLTPEQVKELKKAGVRYDANRADVVEKAGEIKGIDSGKKQEKIITKYKDFNAAEGEKRLELAKEILELVPLQNKEDLAQYVVRRAIEVEILGDYIKKNVVESLIHNLIFQNKGEGIWMLNEDLLNYDHIESNTSLNKVIYQGKSVFENDIENKEVLENCGINNKGLGLKRPDIVIFYELGSVVVIDFKKADEKCFDYVRQVQGYAKLMANKSHGNFKSFYCYLIGETLGLPDEEYSRTSDREGWFRQGVTIKDIGNENSIATAYIEIQKYSRLQKLAKLRNDNFANKLDVNITELMNTIFGTR